MKKIIVKGLTALCLCCLFFITSLFNSFDSPSAWAAPAIFKSAQAKNMEEADDLPSWEDTDTKQAIIDFVEGPAQDILPKDRIAVFDNDGTLWAERPAYFQLDYIEARAKGRLKQELKKKVTDGVTEGTLETLPISLPMTVEDYRADVLDFLTTTTQRGNEETLGGYTSFDVPYINLTYKPMVELVEYLQANGFSVFICSGGGIDFVRAFSEEAYGIPRQNVIGSATTNHYERDDREVIRSSGTPVIEASVPSGDTGYQGQEYLEGGYPTPPEGVKPFIVNPFNDKEGKAVGIERYLGKKPIMAVGNSDGDFFMFDYTDSNSDAELGGGQKPLIVLLNHDAECPADGFGTSNDDCEYTYNSDVDAVNDPRQEFCGDPTACSLAKAEEAPNDNWLVVSMKDDFKRIFDWSDL